MELVNQHLQKCVCKVSVDISGSRRSLIVLCGMFVNKWSICLTMDHFHLQNSCRQQ
jgi:hypothetical protein